jgi:hypothetical protein
MAKRRKKQHPGQMTRKYRSRVEQERRQLRYIYIGTAIVLATIIVLVLAGLAKTRVMDPAATRRAKDELKTLPAVTVNGAMISVADWQARVRFERQLLINQIFQISQQLNLLDASTEFGQTLISQGQAQMEEIQNQLELGDGIASDVLGQMVEEHLIRQEAARRDITVTPDELQRYIEVNLFSYPFPPTPEPFPTLPPPTLAPTATVTPEPTVVPTAPPTPRSRQDFETEYQQYTDQVREITEMSEEGWRSMIEDELYRNKLLEVFGADIETNVLHATGQYISTQEQETADAFLSRLEAGETFEDLVEEIQADESEEPVARANSFNWTPVTLMNQSFGEPFAAAVISTDPDHYYAEEAIPSLDGRFYLVFVEGKENRDLADYLVEQQRREVFDTWLEGEKQGEGVVYYDWREYIPREPSL